MHMRTRAHTHTREHTHTQTQTHGHTHTHTHTHTYIHTHTHTTTHTHATTHTCLIFMLPSASAGGRVSSPSSARSARLAKSPRPSTKHLWAKAYHAAGSSSIDALGMPSSLPASCSASASPCVLLASPVAPRTPVPGRLAPDDGLGGVGGGGRFARCGRTPAQSKTFLSISLERERIVYQP